MQMTENKISYNIRGSTFKIQNELVIVEVKSLDTILDVHHKQLLTYLKLANKKLGLFINFNASTLKNSFTRIVNNL